MTADLPRRERAPSSASSGKLMALDVGVARIGVAVCDPLRLGIRPLAVVERASRRQDFALLADMVQDEEIVEIICGLPLNMDGTEGGQAQTTRKWAMRLAHALRTLLGHPVPISFWDERLSTYAAQEIMADRKERLAEGAAAEDAVAAAVILQSYLDAMRRGDDQDFGRIDLPPLPAQAQSDADAEGNHPC